MHRSSLRIWIHRNSLLKKYNIEVKSVIDFGCGDKSVCDDLNFTSYIGIDKNNIADYYIDFDKEFQITFKGQVGLVLGVLEYLNNPIDFIKRIKNSCERLIILVLAVKAPKYKDGWKRVYNYDSFYKLLETNFTNFTINTHGKYLIADIDYA